MNHFGRYWRAAQRVSRTRYPRFIFGFELRTGEIPVFTYHDVEHAEFERDLHFLRDNDYRTLSLAEYLDARSGKRAAPRRSVLLTFDDARASFMSVALPLLRQFDARATLFAPTYWMSAPGGMFMNWQELRACVDSGYVDVESHAHRHALVAIAPDIVDFAHPDALRQFDIYDWPMRCIDGGDELGRPALGTPVYRAAPLLSATRRYVEDDHVTLACRDHVARSGGEAFFARPQWRQELLSLCDALAASTSGRWLTETELRALVIAELERSREEFETHLGYAPRTLAYPWMLGSPLSLEIAHAVGFTAAFGVALDFGAERRGTAPLPVFGRFKCDWLRFLPGERRDSVFDAVRRKVAGFAGNQHLAH